MIGRLSLLAIVMASICAVGCSGASDAATPAPATTATAPPKRGGAGGASTGLNPNYHRTAAQDEGRVGSAMGNK
jgi:hypothetical protein